MKTSRFSRKEEIEEHIALLWDGIVANDEENQRMEEEINRLEEELENLEGTLND